MIIKSLSRKSGIGRLVTYIFKEQPTNHYSKSNSRSYIPKGIVLTEKDKKYLEKDRIESMMYKAFKTFFEKTGTNDFYKFMAYSDNLQQKPFVIKHNMRSRSINGYIKELELNEAGRLRQSKNQIAAYHTILSWSPKDAHLMNDAMLKEIAKEYIKLRGENIMVVGTKHVEKEHIHLHLAESATLLNGKSSRMSKQEFAAIKIKLQEFQKERYPILKNSLPEHGKRTNKTKGDFSKNKRPERTSSRDKLIQLIETNVKRSSNTEQFLSSLNKEGISPYYRAGKLTGVEYEGLKFRFSRLGYDEQLKELSFREAKRESELQTLKMIRNAPNRQNERLKSMQEHKDTSSLSLEEKGEEKQLDELRSIRSEGRGTDEKEMENDHENDEIEEEVEDNNNQEQHLNTAMDDMADDFDEQ